MERNAVGNGELFSKKSSVIFITIIFMTIIKLIEIAVKFTIGFLLYFLPSNPFRSYNSYLLSALLYMFVLKNFCFKMHLRDLDIKMSSMAVFV